MLLENKVRDDCILDPSHGFPFPNVYDWITHPLVH